MPQLIQAANSMQVVYHQLVQRVAAVKKRFEDNRVAFIKDIEAIREPFPAFSRTSINYRGRSSSSFFPPFWDLLN